MAKVSRPAVKQVCAFLLTFSLLAVRGADSQWATMKTVRRCVLFVGLLLAAVTVPHAQQTTPPEEPGPEFKLIRAQSEFIDVAHPQLTD
jgi:hypothetical protein